MKQTVCIFLAIIAIYTVAKAQEIVKVGAFNYYPAIFMDSEGVVKGFYVDALNELGEKENKIFTYVFGSWDEGLERLNVGEVDLLTSVAITEERLEYMDYTETPVLTVWSEVYVQSDSHVHGILDLHGKTIAVMKSDFNGLYFEQLTDKLGIHCEFVETSDFDEVFKLISNGNADAGIVNNVFGVPKSFEYGILSSGIVFNPFDIFFTVKKDSNKELLNLLDFYLHNWKHDRNSVLNKSQQKWAYKNVGVIEVLPKWLQRAIFSVLLLVIVLMVFLGLLRYKARIATEKAEESELTFRKLFDDSADAILLIDSNGTFVECNQAALNLLLIPREQFLFLSLILISPEFQPSGSKSEEAAIEMIELAFKKGLHRFDWSFVNSKGGEFIVDVSLMPIVLKGQTMLHTTWRDITNRKQAEDQLRKLSQAVEQSPVSVVITDLNGSIEYVNPKFTHLTGYTLNEAKGQTPEVLKSGEQTKEFYNHLWQTISSGKDWQGEFLNKKKNGELYWESASISPIMNSDGKITHYLAVKEDITERKKAEEYQKQLQIAKKTAQFKQNFLANMSHEIRTPLTGVLGMIDILGQTSLTLDQKDYLDTIKTSGEILREIINQVLDYSKIEAGKATISPTVFEFKCLPENAGYLFKNNLRTGVKLKNFIDPKIPAYIEADKLRLSQVLNNFISNAVKFTSQGSITIHSSLVSANAENECVLIKIEVSDTGIGIADVLQKKLFVPFSQIEALDTRHYEGTGLGLSICRQLIEMMGGQTGLISEVGKGSTFWFTFPAKIAQAPENPITETSAAISNKPLRILLAEDKVVNQKVVTIMLSNMGHIVEIANNGEQALKQYEPGKFNLILMDIQMPVMDGITATQKLKQTNTKLPPIVGLSANAFEGDREKYMELGMDDYLTKPFKKEDFDTLMGRIKI